MVEELAGSTTIELGIRQRLPANDYLHLDYLPVHLGETVCWLCLGLSGSLIQSTRDVKHAKSLYSVDTKQCKSGSFSSQTNGNKRAKVIRPSHMVHHRFHVQTASVRPTVMSRGKTDGAGWVQLVFLEASPSPSPSPRYTVPYMYPAWLHRGALSGILKTAVW